MLILQLSNGNRTTWCKLRGFCCKMIVCDIEACFTGLCILCILLIKQDFFAVSQEIKAFNL